MPEPEWFIRTLRWPEVYCFQNKLLHQLLCVAGGPSANGSTSALEASGRVDAAGTDGVGTCVAILGCRELAAGSGMAAAALAAILRPIRSGSAGVSLVGQKRQVASAVAVPTDSKIHIPAARISLRSFSRSSNQAFLSRATMASFFA